MVWKTSSVPFIVWNQSCPGSCMNGSSLCSSLDRRLPRLLAALWLSAPGRVAFQLSGTGSASPSPHRRFVSLFPAGLLSRNLLKEPASFECLLTLHAAPETMAFTPAGSSYHPDLRHPKADFDILEWYPQFQSCHRYFLDHAQHTGPVRALAAYINIQLPYQKHQDPVAGHTSSSHADVSIQVSLIPYIRRLVATGHDSPSVLQGFFGNDWAEGIGSIHAVERRNYLFAAKSTSWMKVKQAYDMSPDESCPFLIPLRETTEQEIQAAEATWSEWLAMQDWMLGPRSPEGMKDASRSKRGS